MRANILGAWPVFARPYKAREEVYRSEEPADQAEAIRIRGQKEAKGTLVDILKKQALAIEGRALIPALWMAMTQAEEAALPVSVTRRGSLEGQIKPRMNTPRM